MEFPKVTDRQAYEAGKTAYQQFKANPAGHYSNPYHVVREPKSYDDFIAGWIAEKYHH